MDLIEFRTSPSKGFKYILVLIEVFSRQVWAAPCKDKTPDTVEPVLRRLLASLPKKPAVIFSDAGNEFVGAVQAMLDSKSIIRRVKLPEDTNALGVIDRAIQNLKSRLAESLSAEHPRGRRGEDRHQESPASRERQRGHPTGGLSTRDSKKKDALTDIMVDLLEFLQDDDKSVASAALWLKTNLGDVGYVDVLRAQGFVKHLGEAIK